MPEPSKPNPLIFIPSIRDIPEVTRHWYDYEFDMLVIKYKNELEAYTEAIRFLNDHRQYTHLIICPDDCEIPFINMKYLLKAKIDNNFDTIQGYSNLQEDQPNIYALQPPNMQDYTVERPAVHSGMWYDYKNLPNKRFIELGICTFACQILDAEFLWGLDWIMNYSFDWQLSKKLVKEGKKMWCDTTQFFYHRRHSQKETISLFKTQGFPNGYTCYKC